MVCGSVVANSVLVRSGTPQSSYVKSLFPNRVSWETIVVVRHDGVFLLNEGVLR